jgi:hypothetical protein
MAKLSSKKRNALPDSSFAGPGRSYPINDASHARNALSRVAANGSPEEKAEIRRKVAKKYPSIRQKNQKARETREARVKSVASQL